MMACVLLAVDVHYDEAFARAAAIRFDAWDARCARSELCRLHGSVAPYRAGHFFERELPCILPLCRDPRVATLVVDGYVDVREGPGLGRHVYAALGRPDLTVVGVAKRRYAGAPSVEVCRGTSQMPLHVTSTGDVASAAEAVARMHGDHRLPTLLKRVDRLARDGM